jgi:hypothetical protein
MLQGFHYPLTPKGKSTLNPLPPWHYSADFLSIEFWADPAAVRAILPEGLDPDPAADGHANGLFYDWQFSGSNGEFLDPARYQYRDFFILLDALFEGRRVSYCPYIFVDNDAALARLESGLSKTARVNFPDKILRGYRQGRSRPGSRIEVCRNPFGGRSETRGRRRDTAGAGEERRGFQGPASRESLALSAPGGWFPRQTRGSRTCRECSARHQGRAGMGR